MFAKIWEWDRFDERDLLRALFNLCEELVLMAMPAGEQARLISDPGEVRTYLWSAKKDVERRCSESLPQELFARLAQIEYILDEMPEDACDWTNPLAFEAPSWEELRNLSRQSLEILQWEAIATSKEHLEALK